MKKLILAVTLLMLSAALFAKEEWKIKSDIAFSATQNSYSDNWEGGEMGSIAWVLNLNSSAEKQLSKIMLNQNSLKLSFGQTHNQYTSETTGDKNWAKPVKSTDLIDFETILRFTLGGFVDPFISGRFESQFLDQRTSENIIINPMVFTETIGAAKDIIKEDNQSLTARLGGGLRQHIDRDQTVPTVEDPDKEETLTIVDGGLSFIAEYKTNLSEIASFTSKLSLYQALYNSKEDDFKDDTSEFYIFDEDARDYWKTVMLNQNSLKLMVPW